MAERVRRRTPKWDVAAEHHTGTENIRHESALPAEVDESFRLTELNHTNHDCRQPLGYYETKPCLSMNVDCSEIDQSASQSGQVKVNNIILSDDFCEKSQYSKQFDLEGDNKDGLKIQDQEHVSQDLAMTEYVENKDKPLKVDNATSPGPDERRRHLSRDANQSGQVTANNIILSDDFCEKSQYSKQFDLEGDSKDGLKIQDQEHVSQDRTMTEYAENKDKSLKVANVLSPGPDERRTHLSRDANQSGQVKASNIFLSDDICEKFQYSKQFDLEGDDKDGLKIQDQEHVSQDRTMTEYAENKDKSLKEANVLSPGPDERRRHLGRDANQSGQVKANNIFLSDDFCEKSQYSKQIDLEGDSKDGLKIQQDRTMTEYAASKDKPLKVANVLSPGPDERRRHLSIEKSQYPKQFDLEGDRKDGLKIQDQEYVSQDRTMTEYAENKDKLLKVANVLSPGPGERKRHLSRDANQSGQVKANNVFLSDDFCEKSQYSKQFDLEGDNKNGLKIYDQEHISQDRTVIEYAENKGKPLKVANAMSPGPVERRRHLSRDASPMDGRGKSGSKRSRSRSLSYDSRSRSPSYASKQSFERWTDKGRMKGAVAPCRDYASGRCRRGSECRYLHEGGGWRQTNRHHDAGPTNERESRFETPRRRHIAYDSKENFINSRENSRETLSRRHEDPYDHGWDNNKQHKVYRSNEICFDFTKGRCFRGTSCRYIHQDASSDDRWRDESRGRFVDRRDGGASLDHRLERHRFSDVPCKYFLEGRCFHGEGCKFFHQARPVNNPEDRSHDIQHRFASVGNRTLEKASEQHDQSTQFVNTSRLLVGGENELRVSDAQPDYNDLTNKSLFNKPAILNQDSYKETQPSELQTSEKKATEFSATVNTEGDHEGERQADLDFAHNPISTTSIANQNVDHKGQNKIAPQLRSAQNFASNSPVGQFAPLVPLNVQMQAIHSFPQSGQSQLATLHKPSDAHYFNASMQNQSGHLPHNELNQQRKLDYGGQVQQNLLLPPHGKSNYNLTGQIQQNLSLIHNARSQPDFTIGGHIQQSLSSHFGNSHQNIVAGDVQQTFPLNVQMQKPSVPLLISNGQRQFLAPQPPSNPQSFKSVERNCQLTSKNNSNSLQQLIRSGEGQPQGGADSSEVKSSLFTPDNPIINKVVTTEQAAKIIDLSASLAQFFGTAALNSQSTAGMTPQALINPSSLGSYVDAVAPIPTEIAGSQTNLNLTAPSTVTALEEKPHEQIHVTEQIKQGEDASVKEVEKMDTLQNKEQNSGDAEDMKDEDSKKIKDAKATRMFKCALVEFVKDILKPTWKEGQLSKEAHKTIVKKVVDKVSGSLQGPNVPQTQEKIDLYLSNAKPKLSKLVQAYVEKYIKS